MLFVNVLFLLIFSKAALGVDIQAEGLNAFDVQELTLSKLCNQRASTCSYDVNKALEKYQLACELQVHGAKCEDFQKSHKDLAPLLRRCDFASLCKQNEQYLGLQTQACITGLKNATIDTGTDIKELSLSLANYVSEAWQKYKDHVINKEQFIKLCDQSLTCKRDLTRDDPGYQQLTDEKLEKLPTAFLLKRAEKIKQTVHTAPLFSVSSGEIKINVEQKEKLLHLAKVAGDKVKEEYQRFNCYSPLAQQELRCYSVGGVVDPVMVAGYFLKATRATVAFSRSLMAEKKALTVDKTIAGTKSMDQVAEANDVAVTARGEKIREDLSKTRTSDPNRINFVNKYLEYSPTDEVQNTRWISLAEKGTRGKTTFFDVENSQIKVLNDTLKEKNLVTSLTNYHKSILDKKMDLLGKKFPGLQIEKYSDFKSMRFAFNGKVPKDIEQRLQRIFSETNNEFDTYLKKEGLVRQEDEALGWFRAGIGKSADQANLAARYSRQLPNNEVQNFGTAKQTLNSKLLSLEKDRHKLQNDFAKTHVLDGSTLNVDAFDIVRKANGDSKKISKEIAHRFGLSHVSEKSIETLQRYVKNADEFSPGLYIAKREIAHLNEAVNGGLSADIIGLGGANLKGTAEALAKKRSVDKAIVSTRKAEKLVTINFEEQKKVFEDVVKRSLDPGKIKTICSGDDCVSIATSPLSEKEKIKVISELAQTKYTGSYRIAFINDGIAEVESRNVLATHGEGIEKILRKTLSSEMEPRKLKGLTFGIDMRTQILNSGQVKLLVGKSRDFTLSASENKLIQKRFQEAIKALNEEMTKSVGKTVEYTFSH